MSAERKAEGELLTDYDIAMGKQDRDNLLRYLMGVQDRTGWLTHLETPGNVLAFVDRLLAALQAARESMAIMSEAYREVAEAYAKLETEHEAAREETRAARDAAFEAGIQMEQDREETRQLEALAHDADAETMMYVEETRRLREGIEDYLLWRPGEAGHAAAHHKLAALVRAVKP